MSKDTSGGVGRPGTAPGTVVQESDAGLVDRGPALPLSGGRPSRRPRRSAASRPAGTGARDGVRPRAAAAGVDQH